ncbi:MAG: F0F1 ATP synthase subunit alpha, partial [Patescibacteria group bacterium]|nr:F0F1 ATP synthase subunit alpha [Patescibacteria group bacterium]
TKKQIDSGRRMTEILKQNRGEPLPFEMEAAVIFAATNGYFDSFAPDDASAMERKLRDYLLREAGAELGAIREEKVISDATEKVLRQKLEAFVKLHAPAGA